MTTEAIWTRASPQIMATWHTCSELQFFAGLSLMQMKNSGPERGTRARVGATPVWVRKLHPPCHYPTHCLLALCLPGSLISPHTGSGHPWSTLCELIASVFTASSGSGHQDLLMMYHPALSAKGHLLCFIWVPVLLTLSFSDVPAASSSDYLSGHLGSVIRNYVK